MLPAQILLTVALAGSPTMPRADNFAAAKAAASQNQHPILLSFSTSWCGWCTKMKKETYTDPRVIAAAGKDFIFLPLDAEDRGEGSDLAKKFRVRSFPTHVVVDGAGRELHRFGGYRPADGLLKEVGGGVADSAEVDALVKRAEASTGDPQTEFELASEFEQAKAYDQAIERYRSLYGKQGEAADRYRDLSLWNLASLYARVGDNQQAIDHYDKYVRAYPASRKAETGLYQIGRLQQLVGQKAEAVRTYQQLLERYPESRYALGVRMQLTFLKGE